MNSFRYYSICILLSTFLFGCDSSTANNEESVQLQDIHITSGISNTFKGLEVQYTATGFFTDGSILDLTETVTWLSSNASIANISASGLALTLSTGEVVISASAGNIAEGNLITSNSEILTVETAELQRIQISTSESSIAQGLEVQYTATGFFTDGSILDLTETVTWLSSNASIVNISASGLALTLSTGEAAISASFNVDDSSNINNENNIIVSSLARLTVTDAVLLNITVIPTETRLPAFRALQYTVTGTFSNNTIEDMTDEVSWSSDDTNIATISQSGLATALTKGNTSINATVIIGDDVFTDEVPLEVLVTELVELNITTEDLFIMTGNTLQYTVEGVFADDTTEDLTNSLFVSWSSDDTDTVIISNNGLATGITSGSVNISAALVFGDNVFTATTSLEVTNLSSIEITSLVEFALVGRSLQYTAIGTLIDQSTIDITSSVIWTSSSTDTVTVTDEGLVTTVDTGTATINASIFGLSAEANLTVNQIPEVCGGEVNDSDLTSGAGTCIKIASAGSNSQLFTGNPSTNVLTFMGYIESIEEANSGFIYSDTSTSNLIEYGLFTSNDGITFTEGGGSSVDGILYGSNVIFGTNQGLIANVTIGDNVTVGNSFIIGSSVNIGENVIIGDDVDLFASNIGNNVIIGDDADFFASNIGSNIIFGDDISLFTSTVGDGVIVELNDDGFFVFNGITTTETSVGNIRIEDGNVLVNDVSIGEAIIEVDTSEIINNNELSQYNRFCKYLADIQFHGVNDWRRVTESDISALEAVIGLSLLVTENGFDDTPYWVIPDNGFFEDDLTIIDFLLGNESSSSALISHAASCVSGG